MNLLLTLLPKFIPKLLSLRSTAGQHHLQSFKVSFEAVSFPLLFLTVIGEFLVFLLLVVLWFLFLLLLLSDSMAALTMLHMLFMKFVIMMEDDLSYLLSNSGVHLSETLPPSGKEWSFINNINGTEKFLAIFYGSC